MTQPAITQPIDVGNPSARELQGLFGLAKCTFGDAPGWDDQRVLEVLQRDIVFVAHRRAQPAGYVALRPKTASRADFARNTSLSECGTSALDDFAIRRAVSEDER